LIHYAQTLDGRIATRTGSSRWISGEESLRFAHELRAAHDAVLVGIETALADDPRLTVRHAEGPDPLKVVVDSTLRLPITAALLRETPGRTILLTTAAAADAHLDRVRACGARVIVAASDGDGRVDLTDGLRALAGIGIRSMLVEGGARIVTSLLRQKLADRLAVCVAPIILGSGVDAIGDLGIAELARALGLHELDVRQLGRDVIVSGEVAAERHGSEPADAGPPRLVASSSLPTRHGPFELRVYERAGAEYPILIRGRLEDVPRPLVRLHSECLTGEVFGSLRCDCGEQLERALELIAAEGCGALLYLRQEGRGIGLANKVRAYHLQDDGMDTIQANLALGLPSDARTYDVAAAILRMVGAPSVRLITNNPTKILGLEAHGVAVEECIPLPSTVNPVNADYLRTKVERMGHRIPLKR
jgi:5-amino-6-(5-phosphoribosylamino)uracil reductase/diaminohydroxyphosphoribosylaminopyrimidine deaminase/5-amino-6-(5-phosphoribosylamino)uracil reductase